MTCQACQILEAGSPAVLHRDEKALALLAAQAGAGHVRIHPVRHISSIAELDDAETVYLFSLANLASTALYESLGAQGTNILLTEGGEHLGIDVVARGPDDGLSFQWAPKQIAPNEMSDIQEAIRANIVVGRGPRSASAALGASGPAAPEEKPASSKEKINYLLKSMRRLP